MHLPEAIHYFAKRYNITEAHAARALTGDFKEYLIEITSRPGRPQAQVFDWVCNNFPLFVTKRIEATKDKS